MLEARGVAKRYGGVVALRDIDFVARPGTVHALLGENGAGKSTLVKILTGSVRPDSGTVLLSGQPVAFRSNRDAVEHGVAVVSQELRLFPELSVLSNLYLLREPRAATGLIDRARMRREAEPVLAELGLDIDPSRSLGELSLADRQLVEIARALLARPSVLVLDEPSSALENASTKRLLDVVDVLRRRGVAVVYVSHILQEVLSLADEITVLRNGQTVLSAVDRRDQDVSSVVAAMLGDKAVSARTTRSEVDVTGLVGSAGPLRVDALAAAGLAEPVTLRAEPGEVVGLAGVAGAGHQSVLRVLAGLQRMRSGHVVLPDGRALPRRRNKVVAAGVAAVSGDRRRYGLMLDKPLWENIAQVRGVALGREGTFVAPGRLRRRAREQVQRLGIRTSSVDAPAGSLSGGNQQKVVFAQWLESEPQVLLLDDPTRGVDVGAKAEMHRLVRTLSEQGSVVLLCSTDIAEYAELCDRVVVFRQQRPVAELARDELSEHAVLEAINALPIVDLPGADLPGGDLPGAGPHDEKNGDGPGSPDPAPPSNPGTAP